MSAPPVTWLLVWLRAAIAPMPGFFAGLALVWFTAVTGVAVLLASGRPDPGPVAVQEIPLSSCAPFCGSR